MRVLSKTYLLLICIIISFSSCNQKDSKDKGNPVENEYTLTSGNYTGLWSSSTAERSFTDLPISASINELASGEFKGSFFISNNFTSCCNSGENDGAVSFTIDNNVLSNFKYDDIIPNCNGLFAGNGKLLEDNSIIINITGTDCDGNHSGTITLSK
ncbi:hypothetical protein [Pontimicrobium sp. SW4]|uniref:Lipocalin-like domain-containing protein n=1 Tax=Pontimicrobium sp. SW4 TaxID=3153519 RepID=A0AAU7BRN3_9FLAO